MGPGAEELTIKPRASSPARILAINAVYNVSISDLTLTGGKLTGRNLHGGAIYLNSGSSLVVENSIFSSNRGEAIGSYGGAIYAAGDVTIRSSLLTDN